MERRGNERIPIEGYVLIQAQPGNESRELADAVTRIPGVVKADRVHGAYDVIAEVLIASDEGGSLPAARAISELDGVLRAVPLSLATPVASERSDGEAA